MRLRFASAASFHCDTSEWSGVDGSQRAGQDEASELKSQRRPEASMLITPSATMSDTSQARGSQQHLSPLATSTTIAINLSNSQPVQMCIISRSACFSTQFPLSPMPTRLMSPVPCNLFSVANCDYRVGVELLAMNHLSQLLLSFLSFFLFSAALPSRQPRR